MSRVTFDKGVQTESFAGHVIGRIEGTSETFVSLHRRDSSSQNDVQPYSSQRVADSFAEIPHAFFQDSVNPNEDRHEDRPPTRAAAAQPSESDSLLGRTTTQASFPTFFDCTNLTSFLKNILLRGVPAALPSIFFAGLSLDNVSKEFFDIDVGSAGMYIEYALYPISCYFVNHATAYESQAEFVQMVRDLLKSDAKNIHRFGFAACAVVACIAAVATIQMALDGAKRMGMTSENPHVNRFYEVFAIICLSVLYTVITRLVAAFGLIFKEIPQFYRWCDRKYHLLLNKDPEYKYFTQDLERFITADIKTEKQFRKLFVVANHPALSERSIARDEKNKNVNIEMIRVFLEETGYRMFPTLPKTAVTAILTLGCPLLGFLLDKLSREGANTLGLHEDVAKIIAIVSVVMTEIFYVRACIKFYDRFVNGYSSIQEAFFAAVKVYFAIFALSSALVSIATSAGFVFESKKYTANDSKVIMQLYKLCWTIYAGLVANGGYLLLKTGDVAQSRLDEKEKQIAVTKGDGSNLIEAGTSAKLDTGLKKNVIDFISTDSEKLKSVHNYFRYRHSAGQFTNVRDANSHSKNFSIQPA